MAYAYFTDEFGLDETGLHRLRSGFAYATLPYIQLTAFRIGRGRTNHRWPLILAFGLLCLGFAGFTGYHLVAFLASDAPGHIDVQEVVVPIIPGLLGPFAIWQALRVADILEVRRGRQRLVFPLDRLRPATSLPALHAYLSARIQPGHPL